MIKRKRIEQKLNERAWLIKGDTLAVPITGGITWQTRLEKNGKELAALLADEEEDPAVWKPNFPDRKEILAMPVFDEFRIHYMCLAGWAYRNIDEYPNMVRQQIYEIARRTRLSGAKYLRSFLINGSRAPSERYIMDALPWLIVKQGRKKVIDFTTDNVKYWEVLEIIEKACIYWRIEHMPTFWMERYNDDIFNRDNNLQNIHGFWTDETVPVKVEFMRDFMYMQKRLRRLSFLSPFEFINEPYCWGNHAKGAIVADHHLALWRGVENLTAIKRAMTCSGACDYAHANFVGPFWFDNRWFGSDEFNRREITTDNHGISNLQSLYDGNFQAVLESAWRVFSGNGDGSDTGSYNPLPWTSFRFANPQEYYDMLYHGHTECQRWGKRFFHTCFMGDCLRCDKNDNMIAKEEFNPRQLENMNWDRPNQYRKMREDLENES